MKLPRVQFVGSALSLCLLVAHPLRAQDSSPSQSLEQSERTAARPPEQLDQLFGPIALYPDPLIALILPAATFPSDIVLAERYLAGNGGVAQVDNQNWDDSVKALIHYPDVIKWMDENLAWTKQAGDAFANQPTDVMNAIQRLRTRARAAGSLVDTPQQQVVTEDDNISIVPAEPDVIYVPHYDPDLVYVSHPGFYEEPFLSFGAGYAAGFWLGYDFDWGRRRIWTIDRRDRERYWQEHRDWHRQPYSARAGFATDHFNRQTWQPRPDYSRSHSINNNRSRPEVVRPVPFSNSGQNRPVEGRRVVAPEPRPSGNDHHRNSDNDHNVQTSRSPESALAPSNVPAPSSVRPVSPSGSHERSPANVPAPAFRRDQENRGDSQRHEGREGQATQTNPPTRITPAQAAPSRSEQGNIVQARPQPLAPAVQSRATVSPATTTTRSDKDDKTERGQRQ